MTTSLRWRVKNELERKYHDRSGGGTHFPTYVIPHAFLLIESCSNNVVEYNTLLIGMQLVEEISVKNLEAHGDSKLIVNQVRGECNVRLKT